MNLELGHGFAEVWSTLIRTRLNKITKVFSGVGEFTLIEVFALKLVSEWEYSFKFQSQGKAG